MTRILGYADRISATPGECIQVMVSCEGLEQFDANLIRVIQGDINPSGPGYREESVSLNLGGPFDGRYQPINAGSYAVINDAPTFNTQDFIGFASAHLANLARSWFTNHIESRGPGIGSGI